MSDHLHATHTYLASKRRRNTAKTGRELELQGLESQPQNGFVSLALQEGMQSRDCGGQRYALGANKLILKIGNNVRVTKMFFLLPFLTTEP